ncbi:MAG: hypothetical protein ACI9E1_000952 [Cryomorphaceae bacterium]|jgi:hypothetical protein
MAWQLVGLIGRIPAELKLGRTYYITVDFTDLKMIFNAMKPLFQQ